MNWKICLFILPLFAVTSCREYSKLLKSQDLDKKYSEAVKYYERGDCVQALQLFEELLTVYKGTPKMESIYFYYAYSNYCVGDYLLAAYHFKTFVRNYPASTHTEECAFMAAYCYYNESPRYSLDQTDTKNAIKELQNYINRFPTGPRLDSCNNLIDLLRSKLEKKDFEIAMQYYHMDDYKASITALNNLLREFPDTKYREQVNYYILRATYDQAIRSIDEKKLDRLSGTIELHNKFRNTFSDTGKFGNQASYIGKTSVILKERYAWEIPFGYFESRKYSKAIDGFKEYLAMFPEGSKRTQALKLMSDSYFLIVQLSYLNIEKQYGVQAVISSGKEYQKNHNKFKSLIDPKYEKDLAGFSANAVYLTLSRGIAQLRESFRIEDVNCLVSFKSLSDHYTDNINSVTDPEQRSDLEKNWKELLPEKEKADREIGFWFFDAGNYDKCREILKKYFPVRENDDFQSKAVYYYIHSLEETTEDISVLRPDFKTHYFDSLAGLKKTYHPLMSPKYTRKTNALFKEIEHDRIFLPAENIKALFKTGQYDSIVKKADGMAKLVTDSIAKSHILYYKSRVYYERARYGTYSVNMLKKVQVARLVCTNAESQCRNRDKRMVKKMYRKLRKRERHITKFLDKKVA